MNKNRINKLTSLQYHKTFLCKKDKITYTYPSNSRKIEMCNVLQFNVVKFLQVLKYPVRWMIQPFLYEHNYNLHTLSTPNDGNVMSTLLE